MDDQPHVAAALIRAAPAAGAGATPVRIDVGGTWIRIENNGVVRREPAPSRINHPDVPPTTLVDRLLDQLIATAPERGRVVISLGAATDDIAGTVRGSGPLWGDWTMDRDLLGILRRSRPHVEWHVFNDVTCGLAAFAESVADEGLTHVGYLTVSSGIALKIGDLRERRILVDQDGLQGEVGHLLAVLSPDRAHLGRLACECGHPGHLASISSGPGIARVAKVSGVEGYTPTWLRSALDAEDRAARDLLASITQPVAELLRMVWVTQPWLGAVGLGGGVIEGLGHHYRSALLGHLVRGHGYAGGESGHWQHRLRVLDDPPVDTLRGAQLLAEGSLTITRVQGATGTT